MCEKFHNDRLRNDRALGIGKSDNNKKNNVRSAWRPVSSSKIDLFSGNISTDFSVTDSDIMHVS